MNIVTATEFRKNLFMYLERVANGEKFIIRRNGKEAAEVSPRKKPDWRKRVNQRIQINVDADDLIKPIEDDWDDYK